jgi:hypothetical protein
LKSLKSHLEVYQLIYSYAYIAAQAFAEFETREYAVKVRNHL